MGETFSGVDYATGVRAAQEFTGLVRESGVDATPAQVAIAWIAQLPGVSTVIPGARNVDQARANAAAGALPTVARRVCATVWPGCTTPTSARRSTRAGRSARGAGHLPSTGWVSVAGLHRCLRERRCLSARLVSIGA